MSKYFKNSMLNLYLRQHIRSQKKDLSLKWLRLSLNHSILQTLMSMSLKFRITTIGRDSFVPKKYRLQLINLQKYKLVTKTRKERGLYSCYILQNIPKVWSIWITTKIITNKKKLSYQKNIQRIEFNNSINQYLILQKYIEDKFK